MFEQLINICGAILLHSSFALGGVPGLSQSKADLEKAAELAVERAAEKAAERAVEKALNSGNSSTITVTIKEAYENAKYTAEEAAAPGSESTKPEDRQYEAAPAGKGQYEVYDSAEAAELGISKEQVNSSVEELQAGGGVSSVEAEVEAPISGEVDDGGEGDSGEGGEVDADDPGDIDADGTEDVAEVASFESNRENADGEKGEEAAGGADASVGLDLSGDFGGLDLSDGDQSGGAAKGDGSFGKRNTFTDSSTSPNQDYDGVGKAEVDDEEDAEIMKMYASDFGDAGWSSAKQQGWIRHRPLWDDTKNRVTRQPFWDDSAAATDVSGKGKKEEDPDLRSTEEKDTSRTRMSKRMLEELENERTSTVKSPPGKLYELLQRDAAAPPVINATKIAAPPPVKVVYATPYYPPPSRGFEKKTLEFMQSTISPKELNDEVKNIFR